MDTGKLIALVWALIGTAFLLIAIFSNKSKKKSPKDRKKFLPESLESNHKDESISKPLEIQSSNVQKSADLERSPEERKDRKRKNELDMSKLHLVGLDQSEVNGGLESTNADIPRSLGSDCEAVDWINDCFQNLYKDPESILEILKLWSNSLNDFSKSLENEVSNH